MNHERSNRRLLPPEQQRAQALGLVAALYAILQLTLFNPARFLEWDEAIYLSEVSPDATAIMFGAHRSRGTTLPVAPAAFAGLGMTGTRLYLIGVAALAMFGSFRSWIHRGWGASSLRLLTKRSPSTAVFAVSFSKPLEGSVLESWDVYALEGYEPWVIYRPPRG